MRVEGRWVISRMINMKKERGLGVFVGVGTCVGVGSSFSIDISINISVNYREGVIIGISDKRIGR